MHERDISEADVCAAVFRNVLSLRIMPPAKKDMPNTRSRLLRMLPNIYSKGHHQAIRPSYFRFRHTEVWTILSSPERKLSEPLRTLLSSLTSQKSRNTNNNLNLSQKTLVIGHYSKIRAYGIAETSI